MLSILFIIYFSVAKTRNHIKDLRTFKNINLYAIGRTTN